MKKSLSIFVSAVFICTAVMLPMPEQSQKTLLADDPPIVIIPPIIIRPATEAIQVASVHTYYRDEYLNQSNRNKKTKC